MQQLKAPFRSCYYLLENGNIFDESTQQEKQADSFHQFRLLTEDNKQKKISQKKLYRELYNKEYCKATRRRRMERDTEYCRKVFCEQ